MVSGRFVAGAVTVVAVIGLSGCDGSVVRSREPLEESPERVRVCIPQPGDDRATLAIDVTENQSRSDLVVRSVRLKHPGGMKVLQAKVMFIPEDSTQTLVGFRRGWPPRLDATETEARQALAKSPDAVGTVLPGDNPQTIAIVVGVSVRPGRLSGPIEIQYEDDRGRRYTWTGPTRFWTDTDKCLSDGPDE